MRTPTQRARGAAVNRFSGRLHTWNEERGYGFIRPSEGGQDIFVHVSNLPRPRPGPDEALTFAVALNAQGKKKAVDVRLRQVEQEGLAEDRRRAGTSRRSAHRRPDGAGVPWFHIAVGIAVAAGVAVFGWQHIQEKRTFEKDVAEYARRHSCDGRTMCSQMNSCVEATYFLRNCPGTQMDGNRDGIPCQQQWCK